jgi:hypothetical protein
MKVFCSCGARWDGKYAENNPVLEGHRERCGLITEAQFMSRFPQHRPKPRIMAEPSDDPVVELERAAWSRHRGRTEAAKAQLWAALKALVPK